MSNPSSPKFTGTIGGKPLTGVFSPGDGNLAVTVCPHAAISGVDATAFTYAGTFAGEPYSFTACAQLSQSAGTFAFVVRGHIGGDAISGSTREVLKDPGACFNNSKGCSVTFPFSGTVGSQRWTGTATVENPTAATIGELVATLTVS